MRVCNMEYRLGMGAALAVIMQYLNTIHRCKGSINAQTTSNVHVNVAIFLLFNGF